MLHDSSETSGEKAVISYKGEWVGIKLLMASK